MKFIEVTKKNLELAYNIQKNIFPESPDVLHIKLSVVEKQDYFKYWIVYINNTPIGISGIYTVNSDVDSIWLSWFGILPSFRSRGLGKKMLLKTIEKCKRFNRFKSFRLHTSEIYNASALPLYNTIMDLREVYRNNDDDNFEESAVVYSISLNDDRVSLWNNRYAEIKELEKIAERGEELLNENSKKIFVDFTLI